MEVAAQQTPIYLKLRLFKDARTETIRPVSEHSVAFTKVTDNLF